MFRALRESWLVSAAVILKFFTLLQTQNPHTDSKYGGTTAALLLRLENKPWTVCCCRAESLSESRGRGGSARFTVTTKWMLVLSLAVRHERLEELIFFCSMPPAEPSQDGMMAEHHPVPPPDPEATLINHTVYYVYMLRCP